MGKFCSREKHNFIPHNYHMLIPLNTELKSICKQIVEENKTLDEWAEIESDDLIRSTSFDGGFDATEKEFVFSYYGDTEYLFQLSLEQVQHINNGVVLEIRGAIAYS